MVLDLNLHAGCARKVTSLPDDVRHTAQALTHACHITKGYAKMTRKAWFVLGTAAPSPLTMFLEALGVDHHQFGGCHLRWPKTCHRKRMTSVCSDSGAGKARF